VSVSKYTVSGCSSVVSQTDTIDKVKVNSDC
jgi:uncharacterized protein YceK